MVDSPPQRGKTGAEGRGASEHEHNNNNNKEENYVWIRKA